MDTVIAKINGTEKAKNDQAIVVEMSNNQIFVIWLDSYIVVRFENSKAFMFWAENNPYIASVHFV